MHLLRSIAPVHALVGIAPTLRMSPGMSGMVVRRAVPARLLRPLRRTMTLSRGLSLPPVLTTTRHGSGGVRWSGAGSGWVAVVAAWMKVLSACLEIYSK